MPTQQAKEKKAKSFTFEEKKVLSSFVSQDGARSSKLRIGRWVVDGKPTKMVLESRDFYVNEMGSEKSGKAKGLTLSDLEAIFSDFPNVYKMLGGNDSRLAQLLDAMEKEAESEPF